MTVYILRGPSGSGQTTFRRHPSFQDALVVSRDIIRQMFGLQGKGKLTPAQENQVTEIEIELLREALRRGQNVVVDNTNLNNNFARRYADEAHLMGHRFVEFNLYNPEDKEKYVVRSDVPKDVVLQQCRQADKMKVLVSRIPEPFKVVEQDETLPHAYIFDIDGTLAKMGDRSPYDYTKVHLDTLIEPVANILKRLDRVFIVSGRSSECLTETVEWLDRNRINYDKLYMRVEGDLRPDSVVKSDILDRITETHYVEGVFDDRHRVLEMWRTRGVYTFDVGQGKAKW